ncbi:MAG TPA: sodium:proton antiporter [Nevskiaceae bacterium]
MHPDLGIALTLLLAVGFLAQWLAWHLRVPAILTLLLVGIVLGPVTGVFDPDRMLGDLLFPCISLAVAVILFEGSMTLRFSDLREVGNAVRGLVTYGALATVGLLALAAHHIAGLSWQLAFLFGALTCVTGPTVITPMLRTLRPNARVARTLRWEGIILDPLGALFAVLVFEALVSHQQGHTIAVFLYTLGTGIGIGLVVAWAMGWLLFRQLIPEYLQAYATLVVVLGAFSLANALADESGLLAVTTMGMVLGNMRRIHIDHIMDFKEHLSTLLVSMLFVILAARLQWPLPPGVLLGGVLVFLAAQFVVRPLSVTLATAGSELQWRERALVSWVSPRGIVAAAVSSLFALRLGAMGVRWADHLVPLVFILIIGTVVLQSITARRLAKWLKVADPDPTGVMIFGSDRVARTVAFALMQQKVHVLVADDDWDGIRRARMAGLQTFYGNPASQHAELHLDLTGIGRLLAMSTRRELNSLTCMQYRQVFGHEGVYHLRVLAPSQSADRDAFAGSIQSKALFENELTHTEFEKRLAEGWQIRATKITDAYGWPQYMADNASLAVPMFALDAGGSLHIASNKYPLEPKAGWLVLALGPPHLAHAPAAPAALAQPTPSGAAVS